MTYRLTAEETYRASRMLVPRWVPIAIGFGAVLILLSAVALMVSGQVTLGVLCALWAVFLLAYRPIVRWTSIRRISTRLDRVPEPIVVTIGPDGIRAARGQSSSVVSWGDVASVTARGTFVWVQGRMNPIYAIPRRAFSGDADAQTFVTAANDFLAASARP